MSSNIESQENSLELVNIMPAWATQLSLSTAQLIKVTNRNIDTSEMWTYQGQKHYSSLFQGYRC